MPKDWNDLTEQEKVEATRVRHRYGHTSVANYERMLRLDAREQAFDEAIRFLASRGFAEASAELEAAAFERSPAT